MMERDETDIYLYYILRIYHIMLLFKSKIK